MHMKNQYITIDSNLIVNFTRPFLHYFIWVILNENMICLTILSLEQTC